MLQQAIEKTLLTRMLLKKKKKRQEGTKKKEGGTRIFGRKVLHQHQKPKYFKKQDRKSFIQEGKKKRKFPFLGLLILQSRKENLWWSGKLEIKVVC